MSFVESVSVALFIIFIVFVVLCGLFLFIRLISLVLGKAVPVRKLESTGSETQPGPHYIVPNASSGEVCLNTVDDKTAAMLMAIVADESGIPLSELHFKSIRQLPDDESK